jgi:hypothetical protein
MKASEMGCSAKTNGIADESTAKFGFNLDAHSFELLSKNLYSNPILAGCREYTTNAIDSLKKSGNEKLGYTTHLPNRFEPFFSIRDRGCGVPPEKMTDLFTFNQSTKRDSNEWNGLFGLGSKSFLAISDSATFTSFYNGTKHVYFVYKDKGIPTYTKVEEVLTDEPNGLEVKIPIADNQIYNVIDTYKKFCRHVEIKPTITGYDREQWERDLKSYSDACIRLGDDCILDPVDHRNSKLTVVFGSVAYPVNRSLSGFQYRHNAIMHIPTGSVDIVPSREELRMTEKTIKYLDTLAPRFQAHVQEKIDETYKNKGFIGACEYINSIFSGNAPKIKGKEQFIKLKISQVARFDYNNRFKHVVKDAETVVDVHTGVVLNFEAAVTRSKTRLKYIVQNNSNPRVSTVVITDKEEAKKYCEHFEVDISTLKHLKDIEPPKATQSGGIKNDRFTGIRTIVRGESLKCEDVDMSKIDTMLFVYRNGTKLFADNTHSQEIDNIQLILNHNPWKDKTIYTLTSRQYAQCKEYGVDMVNLMDDVSEKFNKDEFDKQIRIDLLNNNFHITRDIPADILPKILPAEFQSVVNIRSISNQSTIHQLYKHLGYGQEIITKHETTMKTFISSDVGKLVSMFGRNYCTNPSKKFISKLLTMVVNDAELNKS